MLDNTLIDLQNHVDYLLQLIAENDHTGKWNEVWSMSDGHPNYARYHPPEHDEIDKVIRQNPSSSSSFPFPSRTPKKWGSGDDRSHLFGRGRARHRPNHGPPRVAVPYAPCPCPCPSHRHDGQSRG